MKPYNCDVISGKAPMNWHNYICDSEDDLESIDLKDVCPGSTAIVMNPIYREMILGVDMKWHSKTIYLVDEMPDETFEEILDQYIPLDE